MMRKLLSYGVIQAGRLVDQITITEKGIYASHTPRKESFVVVDSHMVPVIRNGQVIGYQDLFGSDTTIYNIVKGGDIMLFNIDGEQRRFAVPPRTQQTPSVNLVQEPVVVRKPEPVVVRKPEPKVQRYVIEELEPQQPKRKSAMDRLREQRANRSKVETVVAIVVGAVVSFVGGFLGGLWS